jgi:YggT family protein
MPLADAGSSLASFVDIFLWVYTLLLFAYVLTSWIRLPYRPWLNRIQRFLYDVCDPYLRLFRRFLPPVGPLDLSPMVAIIVLIVVRNVLVTLLDRL